MSTRSIAWRHSINDIVHSRQLQALRARIYVLQESGPTAFVVKDQHSPKKYRVTLGDPNRCTCNVFNKGKELCLHILWVILKIFKVPPENPITWQGSLVEREIQEVVRNRKRMLQSRAGRNEATNQNVACDRQEQIPGEVPRRELEEGDCCPICQDDMAPTQHLTYCRYGCGHTVHSRCMKVWADHQLSQGTKILCPMCRTEFGTLKTIMTDHLKKPATYHVTTHVGTTCGSCGTSPITGKIYTCTECERYLLCMGCFSGGTHSQHSFNFKEKIHQRWRPAVRSAIPSLDPRTITELESRDLTENDYETLVGLDSVAPTTGGLSEREVAALKTIMLTKTSSLLRDRTATCPTCLSGYLISQHVVELPCSHRLHRVCAERWFVHQHDSCPVCGELVEVTLPTRRPSRVKRFNLKKDEDEEERGPRLEFTLTGFQLSASDAGHSSVHDDTITSGYLTSSSPHHDLSPTPTSTGTPIELVGNGTTPPRAVSHVGARGARGPTRGKPPRPRRRETLDSAAPPPDLFVGLTSDKAGSSLVEGRQRRRRVSANSGRPLRSRSKSRERQQPSSPLVTVTGTRL